MSNATSTRWTGWIVFAGVILLVGGIFSAVQGLVAVIGPDTYYAMSSGSLAVFDVAGWGWWNLITGLLFVLTALALFRGQAWARVVALILVILSAVGQMLQIPAQPWWSLIVIGIDMLIIYALIVHGRELSDAN